MMRELKVEDALIYLDQVKMEFSAKPEIYNEFLEIMKNFKAQEIDTPGVIRRVSNLFRGYNQLILGFNTFLPEGFKIELKDIEMIEREREREMAAAAAREAAAAGSGDMRNVFGEPPKAPLSPRSAEVFVPRHGNDAFVMGGNGPPPPRGPVPGMPPGPPSGAPPLGPKGRGPRGPPGPEPGPRLDAGGPRGLRPGPHGVGGMHLRGERPGMPVMSLGGPLPPPRPPPPGGMPPSAAAAAAAAAAAVAGDAGKGGNGQPVEFDHAISYVTTIKKRFSEDPETYKTFLEILHTYQREQRGIKMVLDQVSELFRDHPDLLKEFTYFLPDAVQDQAKERLHKAAKMAEMRKQLQDEQAAAEAAAAAGLPPGAPQAMAPSAARRVSAKKGNRGGKARAGPAAAPMVDPAEMAEAVRLKAKGPAKSRGRRAADEHFYVRSAEREFFERVKAALLAGDGGKEKWAHFLKILALYSQEVLSRAELHTLAQQLLERQPDLLLDFKKLLQSRANMPKKGKHGGLAAQPWYGMAVSDVDFAQCRRCTPSYRALPQYFPRPPCSMRSSDDQKCLNDQWVSLPVGSEENYSFKHMRRNNFEETLFKCEDERFEMDMVIDSNESAIRVLEPLAGEIAALRAAETSTPDPSPVFQYKLDPRTLSRVHLNAISRIYGEHGAEIRELLKRNPAGAIPVVLNRLKQKDVEWRRARQELARQWKGLMEQNFHKSLDHKSFYFRTQDKKAITIRALIADVKDAHEQRVHGPSTPNAPAPADAARALLHPGGAGAVGTVVDGALSTASAAPAAATINASAPGAAAKAEKRAAAFADTSAAAAAAAAALTTRKDKQVPPFRVDFAGGLPDLWVPYGIAGAGERFQDVDAFELVAYVTENGNWTKEDKVLMHSLWRDVLGPVLALPRSWFDKAGLGLSLMLPPSANLTGRHGVLPVNTPVCTPYGNGVVMGFRHGASASTPEKKSPEKRSDDAMDIEGGQQEAELAAFYEIKLNHGATAFLRPLLISPLTPALSASSPSSFPAFSTYDVAAGGGIIPPTAAPRRFTAPPRPMAETPLPSGDVLFVGTTSHYGFFRLYALLQARLGVARGLAEVAKERKRRDVEERVADAGAEQRAKAGVGPSATALPSFPTVVSATYALVNGGLETSAFEDTCRQLLGNGAYVLYTIDKLVAQVIRHVHAMATEESSLKCVELWRYAKAQQLSPLQYLQAARTLFMGREDVLYKMHFAAKGSVDPAPSEATLAPATSPEALAQAQTVLAMELLGTSQEMGVVEGKRVVWLEAYHERQRQALQKARESAEPPTLAAPVSAPVSAAVPALGATPAAHPGLLPPAPGTAAGAPPPREFPPGSFSMPKDSLPGVAPAGLMSKGLKAASSGPTYPPPEEITGAPSAVFAPRPVGGIPSNGRPVGFPAPPAPHAAGAASAAPAVSAPLPGPGIGLAGPPGTGSVGSPKPFVAPAWAPMPGRPFTAEMLAGALAAAPGDDAALAADKRAGGNNMFSLGLGLALESKKRAREEDGAEEPVEKKPKPTE